MCLTKDSSSNSFGIFAADYNFNVIEAKWTQRFYGNATGTVRRSVMRAVLLVAELTRIEN